MKLNTQKIISDLANSGVALADQGYLVSVALAKVAAYRLPLPTTPIENPVLYFITKFKTDVVNSLSALNEAMVIDLGNILELTQSLWLFRYRLVYDINNSIVRQFLEASSKVGSRELPLKLSEWLIKYDDSDIFNSIVRQVDNSTISG